MFFIFNFYYYFKVKIYLFTLFSTFINIQDYVILFMRIIHHYSYFHVFIIMIFLLLIFNYLKMPKSLFNLVFKVKVIIFHHLFFKFYLMIIKFQGI